MQTESKDQSSPAQSGDVDESFLAVDVEGEPTEVVFKEPEQDFSQEIKQEAEGIVGSNFWDNSDWAATAIGETPNGNVLQIVKREDGAGYKLGLRNGGNLPNEMTGWYTSFQKTEDAGRIWLAQEWDKANAASAGS